MMSSPENKRMSSMKMLSKKVTSLGIKLSNLKANESALKTRVAMLENLVLKSYPQHPQVPKSKPRQPRQPNLVKTCYHCGSPDHIRKYCPQKPLSPNYICRICGSRGLHLLTNCHLYDPNYKKKNTQLQSSYYNQSPKTYEPVRKPRYSNSRSKRFSPYHPPSPTFRPQSPQYVPESPQYDPESPRYDPESPRNNPKVSDSNTEFSLKLPKFTTKIVSQPSRSDKLSQVESSSSVLELVSEEEDEELNLYESESDYEENMKQKIEEGEIVEK